jgi:hypothetical protein
MLTAVNSNSMVVWEWGEQIMIRGKEEALDNFKTLPSRAGIQKF